MIPYSGLHPTSLRGIALPASNALGSPALMVRWRPARLRAHPRRDHHQFIIKRRRKLAVEFRFVARSWIPCGIEMHQRAESVGPLRHTAHVL